MHSPNPPGKSWRRQSLRGGHVSLDSYERVPLMEVQDGSPRTSRSRGSPLVQNKSISINNDKDPILQTTPPDTSPPLRTLGDLVIVFLVLLLSETARGIVLPTLSPYVTLIGGNAVMLGYAVAAFSGGRFVSTIGLGYLSTTMSYKKVLAGSVAICVVGNFCYGLAFFWGPYVLLVSRFITGFGAGTLSVIRAYVAHVTTTKERTSYMSILGAVQFFGFAIMPGAGSLLSFIPRFYIAGASFDKFTMPGYVLAVLSLALLALIIFEFKNPPPLIKQIDGAKTPVSTPSHSPPATPASVSPISPRQSNSHLTSPHLVGPHTHAIPFNPQFTLSPQFHPHTPYPPPPQFPAHFPPHSPYRPPSAVLVSPQFQPVIMRPLPHSPRLHSPLLADSHFPSQSPQLKPHPPQAEEPVTPPTTTSPPPKPEAPPLSRAQRFLIFGVFLVLNLMVRLVLGIIETIATPVYITLNDNKPGKDIEAGFVFGGLGLIGMGVLFLISYLSKFVKDFKILVSGLSTLVLGTGLLIGHLNLPRFIVGCGLIWCIGYPLAQTIIVSMFSKMLGSKPQGTWMGWIGAMGSLGRIIGPIVSGFLMDRFGQSETMMFGTAISGVCLLTSLLLLTIKNRPSH
eukprot:Phypoly_transcript_04478.p1 GENE.Phypoly_transcript_04478~~Phypoly_transcript_04478.p1  ORF type:complete len:623 (+),score=60.64 Phypoly_transcript_04478:158-2026(+)